MDNDQFGELRSLAHVDTHQGLYDLALYLFEHTDESCNPHDDEAAYLLDVLGSRSRRALGLLMVASNMRRYISEYVRGLGAWSGEQRTYVGQGEDCRHDSYRFNARTSRAGQALCLFEYGFINEHATNAAAAWFALKMLQTEPEHVVNGHIYTPSFTVGICNSGVTNVNWYAEPRVFTMAWWVISGDADHEDPPLFGLEYQSIICQPFDPSRFVEKIGFVRNAIQVSDQVNPWIDMRRSDLYIPGN